MYVFEFISSDNGRYLLLINFTKFQTIQKYKFSVFSAIRKNCKFLVTFFIKGNDTEVIFIHIFLATKPIRR